MWATRDQFYKCWRKQRLKIEEKERRDFDAIIIYFSAGTGKKDRSKLFTWLKMTYNNRVLPSTLLRILLRSGSVDKTTSERKATKSMSVSSVLHWLSYFHFRRWFFLSVPDWASQVAFRFCLCIPPCDHFCARLQRADCWHISLPCCQYTERENLTYRYRWTVTVPITRHHACMLQGQTLDMSTQIMELH